MAKACGKAERPRCPECGSSRIWRDGLRYLVDGSVVQRWLCRDCGFRFSQGILEAEVKVNVLGEALKLSHPNHKPPEDRIRRINPALKEAKDRLPLTRGENIGPQDLRASLSAMEVQSLNAFLCYNSTYRLTRPKSWAKKSAQAVNGLEEKAYAENRAAGATETRLIKADVHGKILEFLWWMKKQGYKESTIASRSSRLRRLVRLEPTYMIRRVLRKS